MADNAPIMVIVPAKGGEGFATSTRTWWIPEDALAAARDGG